MSDIAASWRIASLWRYPVKSLQGEECDELVVNPVGVEGDRRYGILDLATNTVVSAKREGRLLEAAATTCNGVLAVTLPDREPLSPGNSLDEALTTWLDRPVRLVEASEFGAATFLSPEDFEDDASELVSWKGMGGSFVDESPLHLLTSEDLEQLARERPDLQWDVRRFRPNVLLAPAAGDSSPLAIGSRVVLGECEVAIEKGCSRCVMTTRGQPGALDRQLEILRHIARHHDGIVGVRAAVVRRGSLRTGDAAHVRE
ncbi:MAG: MOSC N-terminal beta barrel domain-containing protein [Acidimicrobiales bacterium]